MDVNHRGVAGLGGEPFGVSPRDHQAAAWSHGPAGPDQQDRAPQPLPQPINVVRRCVGAVLAHSSQVGPNPDGVVDRFQLPREVPVPELIPRINGAGGAHV